VSVPEENVTYDFIASDQTVIKLRRMSDRQRTRFFGFEVVEIQRSMMPFMEMIANDPDITREKAQPLYDRYRRTFIEKVRDILVDPADAEVLSAWDHPGDHADLDNLGQFIVSNESPKEEETAVPHPDKVDALDDKEIERLGEPSARKSRRGSTSPSLEVAATSSVGAESTPVKKPAT
jgi:hypothetical protein